jgi:hypothetical protein
MMKIRPVGAQFFHAFRRTDMTKPIVGCRNIASSPNKIMAKLSLNLAFGLIATKHCSWELQRSIDVDSNYVYKCDRPVSFTRPIL